MDIATSTLAELAAADQSDTAEILARVAPLTGEERVPVAAFNSSI